MLGGTFQVRIDDEVGHEAGEHRRLVELLANDGTRVEDDLVAVGHVRLEVGEVDADPPPGGGGRKPAQPLEPQPHLLNPGGQRHVQLAHHVRTIDSIGLQAMPILELLQRRDHARIEAFGSWRAGCKVAAFDQPGA